MLKERSRILDELDKFENPPKKCPLATDLLTVNCLEERCAWWVNKKCAMVLIAQSLSAMAGKGVK